MQIIIAKKKTGTWLRWRTNSNWVWWVVGSYYVSALLFNMADLGTKQNPVSKP